MAVAHRRIAVVGSGPAGLYSAQSALAQADVAAVDVFERLPVPYGLVRHGVAPDHPKTRSVTRVFDRILSDERVRFVGNVVVGSDITTAELARHYDAVVYATGAATDRRLGIEGESLPGSIGAAQLVSWYTGHPDADFDGQLADVSSVVVVGAGNVALDVTRLLVKPADELRSTDMPDGVLEQLGDSGVRTVHVLIRRGPLETRFSIVELRELAELASVDVVVDPADVAFAMASADDGLPVTAQQNLRLFESLAQRTPGGRARQVVLHFWSAPRRAGGNGRVDQVEWVRSVPTGHGDRNEPLQVAMPAQLFVRAIGYRPEPVGGLPYDEVRGVVPNDQGRVRRTTAAGEEAVVNEYVAGWLKRGPSGVIGSNRRDAAETIATALDDLREGSEHGRAEQDVVELLRARGVRVVGREGWLAIDQQEKERGRARGCESVKLATWPELLAVASGV
jgi:ferredoxin--NADP+ reductase